MGGETLRVLKRSAGRAKAPGQRRRRPGIYQRRVGCEPLEERLLLSVGSEQLEAFRVSPVLLVENQGHGTDASIRYAHEADGVNVALTEPAPLIQRLEREASEAMTDGNAAQTLARPTVSISEDVALPEGNVGKSVFVFTVSVVGAIDPRYPVTVYYSVYNGDVESDQWPAPDSLEPPHTLGRFVPDYHSSSGSFVFSTEGELTIRVEVYGGHRA